jgi:hypothetical protein
MQPVSWAPLSIWSWQDALVALLKGRVYPVANYDDVFVRSANKSFEVPSVVALKAYHRRKTIAFTRYHVFLRDEFTCQYCGQRALAKELTFDHVLPRSKGGRTVWSNVRIATDILFVLVEEVHEAIYRQTISPNSPIGVGHAIYNILFDGLSRRDLIGVAA